MYLLLIMCVTGIACGQILFKLASRSLRPGIGLHVLLFSPYLLGAIVLYAATTLLWVWILARMPLSRAYPFMALCFVLVPLASVWLLGEHISIRYWVGVALIMSGLVLILPPFAQ